MAVAAGCPPGRGTFAAAMPDELEPYSPPAVEPTDVPGVNRGRRMVFFVLFGLVVIGCIPMGLFFGLYGLAVPFIVGPLLWWLYQATTPKPKGARSIAADTGTTACPSCGSMMTDRQELLLGNSDTPTVEFTCHNCDHKWR